jgi:hypothetical protein
MILSSGPSELSPNGDLPNPDGGEIALDSALALLDGSIADQAGDLGRMLAETRKETRNLRVYQEFAPYHQVEFYAQIPEARRQLYPYIPPWWSEVQVLPNMMVPLPPVLTYRGSRFLYDYRSTPEGEFYERVLEPEWTGQRPSSHAGAATYRNGEYSGDCYPMFARTSPRSAWTCPCAVAAILSVTWSSGSGSTIPIRGRPELRRTWFGAQLIRGQLSHRPFSSSCVSSAQLQQSKGKRGRFLGKPARRCFQCNSRETRLGSWQLSHGRGTQSQSLPNHRRCGCPYGFGYSDGKRRSAWKWLAVSPTGASNKFPGRRLARFAGISQGHSHPASGAESRGRGYELTGDSEVHIAGMCGHRLGSCESYSRGAYADGSVALLLER